MNAKDACTRDCFHRLYRSNCPLTCPPLDTAAREGLGFRIVSLHPAMAIMSGGLDVPHAPRPSEFRS